MTGVGAKAGAFTARAIGLEKAAVVAVQEDAWKAEMISQTLQPHFGDVKSLLETQANYYWGNDPYSYGSYAIYGKGQWFRVRPILSRRP